MGLNLVTWLLAQFRKMRGMKVLWHSNISCCSEYELHITDSDCLTKPLSPQKKVC
jgi:hypothetical protein